MNKTLIGKNEYLFLINDSSKELEVHCNNLNLVNDKTLSRFKFNNFLLIVFPNKSLIYKDLLPEKYVVKYRPAIEDYKKILNNKLIDTYSILINEDYSYYKTDTHINIKGGFIVYKYFIQYVNNYYNLNINPRNINIKNKICQLTELNLGLGDLLWKTNLGEQIVKDCSDIFYYCDEIEYIYHVHKIENEDKIRILSKSLTDETEKLHLLGAIIDWNILSNFILYQKNDCNNKLKVLIFYDSFLSSLLSLYLELFHEVFMIKEIYNNDIINIVKPDYVFEFRVERFLF